jgi:glycosyltransferase involved in cell wall biosynthesis
MRRHSNQDLRPLKVVFAPDWRDGVSYQGLLEESLRAQGVEVAYLRNYKRLLPLSRGLRLLQADLLHLHWPEAYYPPLLDGLDILRRARFPIDLALALRQMPMVITAHNTFPHNRRHESFVTANCRAAYRRARRIFVHSSEAGAELRRTFGVPPLQLVPIPPGDLSRALPPLLPKAEARRRVGLPENEPVCLVFGVIEPYKGIEEIMAWWKTHAPPVRLVVAGRPHLPAYGETVRELGASIPGVRVEARWQSDEELLLWLSAADCSLFNYKQILTSGAAPLARSLGIPVLLPERLASIDLQEPHPLVLRYRDLDGTFLPRLIEAVRLPRDFDAAASWRQSTGWPEIGRLTAEAYRAVLKESQPCAA